MGSIMDVCVCVCTDGMDYNGEYGTHHNDKGTDGIDHENVD